MTFESSRRDFLRRLAGQAARSAGELVEQPRSDGLPPPGTHASAAESAYGPSAIPAAAPRAIPVAAPGHCASLDEVCALANEVGLGGRRDAVLSICRWSLRLTPAVQPPAAATAPAPPPPAPPAAATAPAPPALELDLGALGALGEPGLLPVDGRLAVLAPDDQQATDHQQATGHDGDRSVPCSVQWTRTPSIDHASATGAPATDAPATGAPATGAPATGAWAAAADNPLELAPELMLPVAWAAPVQSLGLEPGEAEAWERLRCRLAALQGTVPFDGSPEPQSLHRLLGYPDEHHGEMPPAWLLLVQLSDDERLGWSWGDGGSRLYVWIHEADLAARDFTRVRAFVH